MSCCLFKVMNANYLYNVQISFVYTVTVRGVSRIFERGGPISLGSLKKGHQILKGGSNGLMGGAQYISLPKTTNLAYLDAYLDAKNELTCTLNFEGSQMKRGGSRKKGGVRTP